MNRKLLTILIACVLVCACLFTFAACDDDSTTTPPTSNENTDQNSGTDQNSNQNSDQNPDTDNENTDPCASGHTEVIDAAKAATCTEKGLTEGKHCSVCNKVLIAQTEIPATGHSEVIDAAKAATCTEKGLTEGKHCSVCNTVLVAQTEVAAKGHTWSDWVVTAPAIGNSDGVETRTCSICQATESQKIPATGHSFGEWTVTTPATCECAGVETRTCSICQTTETRSIAAKGHIDVIDIGKTPTCTETGLTDGKHCSVCNTVLVAQTEIPATGHSFGGWVVTKQPTESAKGEKRRDCSNCDHFETDTVAELSHDHSRYETIVLQKVAPTCTKTGLTEGKKCSGCGEILVAQQTVAATGHTEVIDTGKAATCTESGLSNGKHCSVCNTVLIAQTEIPATGHTEVIDAAKAATCTEKGLTEGKHCSICNTVLIAQTEIPATGHTEVIDAAKAANCTETGLTEGKHCSICNTVLIAQTEIPANGHSYGDWIETLAPSCTAKGSECRDCRICDHYETRAINAKGHTNNDAVVENKIDATCTENGSYDSVIYCSVCNAEISREKKTIVSGGHQYNAIVTPPTSKEQGYTTHTCTVCSDSYVDSYVPATGSIGLAYEKNSDGTTCTITGLGTCTDTDVVIPETIDGYKVTAIGEKAFADCTTLTFIKIPETVKSIGTRAFYGCTGITEITIPASVTSIGVGAFSGCYKLVEVINHSDLSITAGSTINGYVAYYAKEVHTGSSKIVNQNNYLFYTYNGVHYLLGYAGTDTELTLLSNYNGQNYEIYQYAFYGCSSLTGITIPEGVTSIGSSAFSGCYKLVEVINHSNLSITAGSSSNGYVAYYAKEVHTGSSKIVNQNDYFFYTYNGVNYLLRYAGTDTELTLPRNYNGQNYEIYKYAFFGCSSLTSITIPDSVTSIGEWAFYNCSSLTNITIPDSVTSIGKYAFDGCSSLTSIAIPFVGATKDGTSNTHFGYIFGASSYDHNDDHVPTSLKTVVITGGTSIASYAFRYCSNLTSITMGNSVTSIGDYAFYNCSSLTSIIFAENSKLTSIGYAAFSYCSSLTSITMPDSVTSIDGYAFYYCNNLKDVYITDVNAWLKISFGNTNARPNDYGTLHILDANGNEVTNLVIPDTVTKIKNYTFSNCKNLTSITIPEGVTSIGSHAFYDCSRLTSITIPASVTSIGERAFYDCSRLTSITIPEGVTSIGSSAFYDCSSLTSITIPEGVTSIGSSAFYDCDGLTSITMPDSVTSIGEYAFYDCSSLTNITFAENSKLTSIGKHAFDDCSSLTSITIPEGVTSIGSSAFYSCYKLVEVINHSNLSITAGSRSYGDVAYYAKEVHTGSSKIVNQNDYLFYTYNGVHYLLGYAGTDTELTLLSNYNGQNYEIYQYAFYGCSSLTGITIPDSVTSIGSYAFSGCYKLVEVINHSDLSITAGSSSNGYVASYAIEVHNGSSKILNQNDYLFYTYNGVHYLLGYVGTDTKLTLPSNYNGQNYEINRYAFYNCDSLTSITIPDSVTSIGEWAFYNCSSLTSIKIPDSVTSIGNYAFIGCSSLTGITIPFVGATKDGTSNTHFGYIFGASSYSNNGSYVPTSLKTVVITGGTRIGSYAFYGCNSLTSITIPNSVTSIDSGAFFGCSNLTSITIPDSVTSIGNDVFKGCSSLTSITIPNSVTSIGEDVFKGCSSLTSITIPDSVKRIGWEAFYDCSSLNTVYYGGTASDWAKISIVSYGNTYLTGATRYYYSTTQPTTAGNYWHYVDGVPTKW